MDAGGGGGQSRVQGGPGSGGDEKPAPLWGRDRRDPPAGPEKEQELVSVAREAESRGGGGVIGSPSGRVTSPGRGAPAVTSRGDTARGVPGFAVVAVGAPGVALCRYEEEQRRPRALGCP